MEYPYLANLDDEHPEEKNYASEHPEVVKRLMELIDKWEEDVFLHTSVEEKTTNFPLKIKGNDCELFRVLRF